MGEYPIVEYVTKTGETIEAYKLPNGTLASKETWKFLTPPDDEHKPIKNQEDASNMVRARWEGYYTAAEQGAMEYTEATSGFDAWRHINRNMARLAMGDGRTAVDAASFLGRSMNAMPQGRQAAEDANSGLTISVSRDFAADLLAKMLDRRQE